ncbi:protein-glutamate methylesterase/protein-glutamine glutaminase [Desulfallas thermosapovorans]|uniref:Protein-glutamate methylesterase/protein-glutamine glutaminase n=1 Tax=Desulfallas thermosapovorans DSM 6562 TaxID=1121431 RepID=A0A5S4ZTL3_9FIRM|nr:chemotaxis response regulator protein-glutamate methylesterase [Desulfallas thermosapovorans]TYO95533.1 two-component system chemotaxis response regulator CheB [Desulfallas thermosapovorans DSM 6562]
MPRSINVLVVDDSALMRRIISRLLETRAGIKVIDTAAGGEEAIKKVRALRPDVVTMDVEMPGLNGVQTVSRLMKECPVPVVMLSGLTTKGARVTMEALAAGAVDFVPKPQKAGGTEQMVAELARKIRVASRVSPKKCPAVPAGPRPAAPAPLPITPGAPGKPAATPAAGAAEPAVKPGAAPSTGTAGPAAGTVAVSPAGKPVATRSQGAPGRAGAAASTLPVKSPLPVPARVPAAPVTPLSKAKLPGQTELVVIGSSTGGPAALQTLLPALPGDLPCGIVVVQHIPKGFSGPMAEHLDRKCKLAVKHAQQGDRVAPGLVLVAPAGYDLTFRKIAGRLTVHLDKGDKPVPPGGFRPSVDGVMSSAAQVAGGRTLGVLLTGMGRDGARGMLAIKQQGGYTIAQDESTSVVYGMPKAAADLGAAEKILPLQNIAAEITRLV